MTVLQFLMPPTRSELIARLEDARGNREEFLMELRMYGYRCEVQVLFGVLAVILIVFIGITNKILQ